MLNLFTFFIYFRETIIIKSFLLINKFRLTDYLRYADEVIMWNFSLLYIAYYIYGQWVQHKNLLSTCVNFFFCKLCMFVSGFRGLQLFAQYTIILLNILTMFADITDIQTDTTSLMAFGTTKKFSFLRRN